MSWKGKSLRGLEREIGLEPIWGSVGSLWLISVVFTICLVDFWIPILPMSWRDVVKVSGGELRTAFFVVVVFYNLPIWKRVGRHKEEEFIVETQKASE